MVESASLPPEKKQQARAWTRVISIMHKDLWKPRRTREERSARNLAHCLRNGTIALALVVSGILVLVVDWVVSFGLNSRSPAMIAGVLLVAVGGMFATWTIGVAANGIWFTQPPDPRVTTGTKAGLVLASTSALLFISTILFVASFSTELMSRNNAAREFSGADYDWTLQYRAGIFDVNGISALDSRHMWAATGKGIMFFDGTEWRDQYEVPKNDESFPRFPVIAIDAVDETHVWALGGKGQVLFFDGRTWTGTSVGGKAGSSSALCALDSEHVWAVVDEKVHFFDGSAWRELQPPAPYRVTGVSAVDDTHLWATSNEHVLFFNGNTWEVQLSLDHYFWQVFASDPAHVWVEAGSGILWFFDGTVWEQQYDAERPLMQITGAGPSDVWAVGTRSGGGTCFWYVYHNDGTGWCQEYESPGERTRHLMTPNIEAVAATSAGGVWIGGYAIYSGKPKNREKR